MMAFDDTPEVLLYLVAGAFVAGWLVAKISAFFGRRLSDSSRDPRDDRIRSLEAELRIARSDADKVRESMDAKAQEQNVAQAKLDEQAATIQEQLAQIGKLRTDLKLSVKKTDELRNELTDRAEENLRSTVKLREVETELSVARASSDLISTGVLDYPLDEDGEPEPVLTKSRS